MELFHHFIYEKTKHFIQDQKLPVSYFPNQIYHTNTDMALKLPSGEYWYTKGVKKTQREKRAILARLPANFEELTC